MYKSNIKHTSSRNVNKITKIHCLHDNSSYNTLIFDKKKHLNSLFYSCPPLTPNELSTLVKNRRIQLSTIESGIELYVFPEVWENVDELTWSGMSEMLNVWHAGDQIRKNSTNISDTDISIIPIFIPDSIKYGDDYNHTSSSDYIDVMDVSSF